MRKTIVAVVILGLLMLMFCGFGLARAAEGFADALFEAKWNSLDLPVAQGTASYSWFYGPTPGAHPTEAYAEAPGSQRLVQYFDKARMELTRRPANPDAVTTGLLTAELVSGNRQTGDATFVTGTPANVPVAGDSDDATGPTYASFKNVSTLPGAAYRVAQNIDAINQTIARDGTVRTFSGTRPVVATNAYYIAETGHNIPDVFINWLTKRGNWADITGFPIAEAYWATVKVGGVQKTVLIQLYERRVLTFTASNSPQYQVEYGNIGQHYYTWRYTSPTPPTTTVPPTTTPLPTIVPTPANYNGVWRGTTAQGNGFYFSVEGNAISNMLFQVDPNTFKTRFPLECNPYAYFEHHFGATPVALTSSAFSFAIPGITAWSVNGTFGTTATATGIVTVSVTTKVCRGTAKIAWTATKDAPATDTSLDGTWVGTTSQGKPVSFVIVNHNFRSFHASVTDWNLFDFDNMDFLAPGFIAADQRYAIRVSFNGGTPVPLLVGNFTSATDMIGECKQFKFSYTAKKVSASTGIYPTGLRLNTSMPEMVVVH